MFISLFSSPFKTLIDNENRYAYKYQCPQIFCFDHAHLLMVQFRARDVASIRDAKCGVDCWIFPRNNKGGTPLRYALYRLLLQGFRRCQSLWSVDMSLQGVPPHHREFYNGQPVWKMGDGKYTAHPWGYSRKVDPLFGAFFWVDKNGNDELDDQGNRIWDTGPFWDIAQAMEEPHGGYQQGGPYVYPQAGYGEDFYGNV